MKYLLDTHTLIWAITEKNKLPSIVQKTIEDTNNQVFVSAISFWEVSLKFSIGKLQLEGIEPEQLPSLSLESGFELIPLSPDESASYNKLPLINHKDPFDRMLIWQAIKRSLIFITKDANMNNYSEAGLKTLW